MRQPCVAGSLRWLNYISEGNPVIRYAALTPKRGCKVTAFRLNGKINNVIFSLVATKTVIGRFAYIACKKFYEYVPKGSEEDSPWQCPGDEHGTQSMRHARAKD